MTREMTEDLQQIERLFGQACRVELIAQAELVRQICGHPFEV